MNNASEERTKQFNDIIASINKEKKYNTSDNDGRLLAKLGEKPLSVETVSSGSLVLDKILGGGLAKGRIIEIYGPESSGKTSIALTAVGNVQKLGGNAVFLDVENALDPKYAARLGVDTANLAVAQPNSAEQTLDLLQDLSETGVVDIIVLDSVAALVPEAELAGDASDVTIGLIARLLSKSLRKLISSANKTKTTIIFINQTRDKIGGFSPFGTPQTTTGGKALKFYASQRIEIKKGQPVKGEAEDKGVPIGTEVKFKIVKNKVAPPFGTGESVLTFNQGINLAAEMVLVGPSHGVITMPNNRTYVESETGEIFGKSKREAIDRLNSDNELLERLKEAVAKKIEADLHGLTEVEQEDDEPENVDED